MGHRPRLVADVVDDFEQDQNDQPSQGADSKLGYRGCPGSPLSLRIRWKRMRVRDRRED